MKRVTAFGVALLLVTSFSPETVLPIGFGATFYPDTDYLDSSLLSESAFIETDEGYLMKTNPQNGEVNRIGMVDKVIHTVEGGETCSGIATRYGLKMETIIWENNLRNCDVLQPGQSLTIPPVDGVTVMVASGDTVNKIAQKYNVDTALIAQHNQVSDGVIVKGQELFIPGGRKIERAEPRRVASVPRDTPPRGESSSRIGESVQITSSSPNEGKELIFPTYGKLTQGFRGGHYALDIGNPEMPAVWAAGGGRVIEVENTCLPRGEGSRNCGGGYGNHVIIDHDNGLQTLYAHLDVVHVSVGDVVNQGQSLGIMGNSGRVWGATGIHLHWECIDNGVKRNCQNYY